MSDQLKTKADAFRAKQMAAQSKPTETDAQILDLTDTVEQAKQAALAATSTPQTPPKPKLVPSPKVNSHKPTNQTTKKAQHEGSSRGTVTLNMPSDLDETLVNTAQRHDVWTVEYLRAAIAEYGPKIPSSADGPRRRRSRTATRNPSRTYHLGEQAKNQLQNAAKRTHRSQSSALIEIVKQATKDDFALSLVD